MTQCSCSDLVCNEPFVSRDHPFISCGLSWKKKSSNKQKCSDHPLAPKPSTSCAEKSHSLWFIGVLFYSCSVANDRRSKWNLTICTTSNWQHFGKDSSLGLTDQQAVTQYNTYRESAICDYGKCCVVNGKLVQFNGVVRFFKLLQVI